MTVGQQEKVKRVIAEVCRVAQIDEDALYGRGKQAHVAAPRQAAMYCLTRYLGIPSPQVGTWMYRNYATVLWHVRQVEGVIDTPACEVAVQEIVNAVRKELGIEITGAR